MRKVLAWTLILTTAIALAFVVAMLMGSMETITLSASGDELIEIDSNTVYTEKGESFFLQINQQNKNPNTEIHITSSDESIVLPNEDGSFTALNGGRAVIKITTTNIYFKNLKLEVFVGDGSVKNPYFISSEVQLASIGAESVAHPNYSLESSYKLITNLDLEKVSGGLWRPLGVFAGNFDGGGYEIKNITINRNKYIEQFGMVYNNDFINNGLFSKVLSTARVYNLKIKNFVVQNITDNATSSTIGAVAGINHGKIERIKVVNANINTGANFIGGVVGVNQTHQQENSAILDARLDRVGAIVNFGDLGGVAGTIGGVVGKNESGVVIYSYALGKAHIADSAIFGGVIGENTFDPILINAPAARIKDSYSSVALYNKLAHSSAIVGGVVGINNSTLVDNNNHNIIMGTYYNYESLNIYEEYALEKNFKGIGRDLLDGNEILRSEDVCFVYPYNSAQLKDKESFISHQRKETVKNSNGETINESTIVVKWSFNKIWEISKDKNNGYPYSSFKEINSMDTLDYSEYDDFETHVVLNLDAYILTLNQVFNDKIVNNHVSIKVYNENDNLIATSDSIYNLPVLSDAVVMNFGKHLIVYRNGIKVYKITAESMKLGYDITGWANKDGVTNWSDSIACNKNMTLTATVKKVTLRTTAVFNYNGATGPINLPSKQEYIYGERYGLLPVPVKLGSWFDGWYLESNFITKIDESSQVATTEKTHQLYAKWRWDNQTHYTISYNSNGGVGFYSESVKVGGKYTIASNVQARITRPGYRFMGWSQSASGSIYCLPGQIITPTSDMALFAIWSAEGTGGRYTATALRHNNSPKSNAILDTVVNGDEAMFTIKLPKGYSFVGWCSNPYYTSTQDIISKSPTYVTTLTNDLALYAYWEVRGETCPTCGSELTETGCPNEKYCYIHSIYYHGACPGKDLCIACGRLVDCGRTCPAGKVNICPEHGAYHGNSCPNVHRYKCGECNEYYTGKRCPNEKYCNDHDVYYHGSCPKYTVCKICNKSNKCGVACTNHNVCKICGIEYTGKTCPAERFCKDHNQYVHGICKTLATCKICGGGYVCGSTCMVRQFCPTHGIYHGRYCPYYHVFG